MSYPVNIQESTMLPDACKSIREDFSDYLDGAVTGVKMNAIAAHLAECSECEQEFAEWCSIQQTLSDLGPAKAPARLQSRLIAALSVERERGTHLGLLPRMARLWDRTIAPLALRLSLGAAVAAVLLVSVGVFYTDMGVLANDENMAHLVQPRYLYSQVPPQPIENKDIPVVVEAKVDTSGRVYDYAILEGPQNEAVKVRVQENLLASVFTPATVFGVPVRGHVVITYSGVSVHG